MTDENYEEDEEFKRVIQLSRETFAEEQKKRGCESPDLLGGDPAELAREKHLQEITEMFKDVPSTSAAFCQPKSVATLPYGFRPPNFFSGNTVIPFPPQHVGGFSSVPQSPSAQIPPSLMPRQQTIAPPQDHAPSIVPFLTREENLVDLDVALAFPSVNRTSPRIPEHAPQHMQLDIDAIMSINSGGLGAAGKDEVPPPLPPRRRHISVANLLEICPHESTFKRECTLFEKLIQAIANDAKNTYFMAPYVDYRMTLADSIKFVVQRGQPWPDLLSSSPKQICMTYESSCSCEDLLIAVLCKFNTGQEDWATINVDEFVLKLYGMDDLLEPKCVLGNLPYVAKCLSRGEDVLLQVSKRYLNDVDFLVDNSYFEKPNCAKHMLSNTLLMDKIAAINKLMEYMEDKKEYTHSRREELVALTVDLCKFCFNVQTIELKSAMDTMMAAGVASHYQHAKRNLLLAIYNLIQIVAEATDSDLTLKPLSDRFSDQIKESSVINDDLMVYVESMHNMSPDWFDKYRKFFVDIRLMNGPNSASSKYVVEKHFPARNNGIVSVFFSQHVQMTSQVMVIPRSAMLVVMLYGVLKEPSKDDEPDVFLGYTFMPVFDYEGFLHQGKAALPLYESSTNIPEIEPWGPRPLIRNPNAPIIILSTVEYQYLVRFPTNIEHEQIVLEPFESLKSENQAAIMDLIDSHVGYTRLNPDDKALIWSSRKALTTIPSAFGLFLASVERWDSLVLSNIYPLLELWAPPSPQLAMNLLLPFFHDLEIRKKAVEIIRAASSEFLINLLPQLVEALRYEAYENSTLAVFLTERCKVDRRFATILVWELDQRVMNEDSAYGVRCCFLRDHVLKMEIPNFAEDISCQKHFLKMLDKVCIAAKNADNIQMANRIVQRELSDVNEKVMTTHLRLPINPGFLCTSINVEDCSVFNSLTRPLKLSLTGQLIKYEVIYKVGDDLRQDAIVLQMVKLMNDLWLRNNLDLRLLTYRVLPTGIGKGLIEMVPDVRTLREVQISLSAKITDVYRDDTILNYIAKYNSSEFNYRTAFDNFTRSCAAWCVCTYVLGIGDRHNDNILISTSGHVFHIDFGKYMGERQTAMGINRDRVHFVLTPDMAVAINNGSRSDTERFQDFIDYCCKAYNILRHNSSLLLNMIRIMSCSSVPNMDTHSVDFVEGNLMLKLSDAEAAAKFTEMIRSSLKSIVPRMNFLAHTFVQKMTSSSSSKPNEKFQFSFTNETHTLLEEGRIFKINIVGFEKWKNPSKVYMYVFNVFRVNEKMPSRIYRSFEEVAELYAGLTALFQQSALPLLNSNTNLRSNVRSTAEFRTTVLQQFFMRFLELNDEITASDLVYTFFHAIHRDTNPEIVKDGNNQSASVNELASINISLTIEKDSKILKIFVHHARNLPQVGVNSAASPDTYVKTYLFPDRMTNSKRKSDVVKDTCNPTYNTAIEYKFDNEEDMKLSNLEVSIWCTRDTIFSDNIKICGTIFPVRKVFSCPPDVRGTRRFNQWFTLATCV